MATTRLNKSMIEAISNKASLAAGAARANAFIRRSNEVAIALHNELVGEETLAIIASLPAQFKSTQRAIYVGLIKSNDEDNKGLANGVNYFKSIWLEFGDYILSISDRHSNGLYYFVEDTHPLISEYLEIGKKRNEDAKEVNDLKYKIKALLSSVSTVEKAIELWPEGVEFLVEYTTKSDGKLPAVCVEDIKLAFASLAA